MALDFTRFTNTKLKVYGQDFILAPKQLRKFSTKAVLNWQKVKFTDGNRVSIPQARGIYAFVVEHNGFQLPPHGYVMYVGITGKTIGRTLRKRYGEYLREKKVNKRAGVHYMLNNWAASMFFHYAVVTDKRYNLSNLEVAVSDAIIPPYSTNDFSAEIRQAKKAF